MSLTYLLNYLLIESDRRDSRAVYTYLFYMSLLCRPASPTACPVVLVEVWKKLRKKLGKKEQAYSAILI